MKELITSLVVCAMSTSAIAQSGQITICRISRIIGSADNKTVRIPSGSSFTNAGPTSEFVITTTEDVDLPPKPRCATVAAEVTENQGGVVISPKTAKGMTSQFSLPGVSLEAKAAKDFK